MAEEAPSGSAETSTRGRMSTSELSWALRVVTRASADLDHALATTLGLRPLDYEAMGHLMRRDATGVGPAELGQRLGISTGSATELADRLERAGHIARERDGSDRRRVHLVPQPTAVSLVLEHLEPIVASIDELARDYTDAERTAIQRYLLAVAEELHRHVARLPGSPISVAEQPER